MKGSGSFIRNLSVLLVVASFGSCHKDIENVDRPIIQNKLLVASEYGHRHNEILTQLLANEAIASIDTMTLSTALQILDTTVAIYWRLGYTQEWDSLASAQNILVNRITNELCYNDDVFYVIDSALLLIDYNESSIGLSSTFAEAIGALYLAEDLEDLAEAVDYQFGTIDFGSPSENQLRDIFVSVFDSSNAFWSHYEDEHEIQYDMSDRWWIRFNDALGGVLGLPFDAETFGLASIILADQLSAATERQLSIKNN